MFRGYRPILLSRAYGGLEADPMPIDSRSVQGDYRDISPIWLIIDHVNLVRKPSGDSRGGLDIDHDS